MNMNSVLSFACALAITASIGAPYALATGTAASKTAPNQKSITTLTADEATSQGFDQILEGTVRALDVDELMKMEGAESNADLFEGECAVLVFDEATDIVGTNIATDKPQTARVQLYGLTKDLEGDANHFKRDDGSVEPWKKLDGQRVTIGVKQDETYYATEINPFVENPIGSYGNVVLIKDAR